MRVIGIPYESGAAHPGPSLGPVVVKQMIDSGNPDIGTVHMGMVPIHAGGGSRDMAAEVQSFFSNTRKAVWIGGDHTVTFGVLSRIAEPFDMFMIDAHDDMVDGDYLNHETWLAKAFQETLLQHVTTFGVRTFHERHPKVNHVAVHQSESVLKNMHKHHRPFYVTIDIDGFDPAVAPGTGNPVYGGLTNVHDIARWVGAAYRSKHCLGVDIVEYNPLLDPTRQTCHLIVNMLSEMMTKE